MPLPNLSFVLSVKTQIFGGFPWYLQAKDGQYLKMNNVMYHKISYCIGTSSEVISMYII